MVKKWEVTIMELEDKKGKKYKVTKRIPELLVSETRIFRNKEEAKRLFNEWLK
jgi:hypothetical protein